MKRSHKKQYVDAMFERVKKLAHSKANPVCFDAYRLFDKACDDAGVPHTFSPDDAVTIVSLFSNDLAGVCDTDAITLLKASGNVVTLVGHGRQAEYGPEATPAALGNAAVPKRSNPASAFVAFGRDADKGHSILQSLRERRLQPIFTATDNAICETEKMVSRSQLPADDLEYIADQGYILASKARAAAANYRLQLPRPSES